MLFLFCQTEYFVFNEAWKNTNKRTHQLTSFQSISKKTLINEKSDREHFTLIECRTVNPCTSFVLKLTNTLPCVCVFLSTPGSCSTNTLSFSMLFLSPFWGPFQRGKRKKQSVKHNGSQSACCCSFISATLPNQLPYRHP